MQSQARHNKKQGADILAKDYSNLLIQAPTAELLEQQLGWRTCLRLARMKVPKVDGAR